MHSTTNGSTPHTDSPNLHLIRAVCGHNGSSDAQYDSMSRFLHRIEHQRLTYNLACYFCGHQVHTGVDACIFNQVNIFCSESCAWDHFQGLVPLPLTKERAEYQELVATLDELKQAATFIANTVAY